ncbi:MAG: aldehyde dehydrogenase family protein [Pirellulaceae bacterium]|nr:aldehyde dehydrogenase family protein [Pirellulaceae bacterium]
MTDSLHPQLVSLGIQTNNPGACQGPDQWITESSDRTIASINPTNGQVLANVTCASEATYNQVVDTAAAAFQNWRSIPAPQRGQVVRELGESLRAHRDVLGELVSLEMGKIRAEGIGEVQEMIDICEFAVGLSRQLCGSTMHSERPGHRMYEQYHPLGAIGIISAFNFPVAVWAWNAALAAICGDTMIWKPSPQTPLTAIAVQHLCNQVMEKHDCAGVFNLVIGENETVGQAMIKDKRLPLISFTGSCDVGKHVAETVGARMGKTLLELGGNNALIVEPDADLDLATRAIVFGAVGTSGQRCTTTRRLLVHESVIEEMTDRLVRAYEQVKIGDPLQSDTLMGPLASERSIDEMSEAIQRATAEGGKLLCGGKRLPDPAGFFVEPSIIRMPSQTAQVSKETFAPILYMIPYSTLEQAIQIQNDVPQGLSSSIFTTNLLTAETFLSACGSDCGIANVNIGTSGAEIGGAFGGEKDTGGGRESGSDAWKTYMRRQTNTINWSKELPLAQGIQFG